MGDAVFKSAPDTSPVEKTIVINVPEKQHDVTTGVVPLSANPTIEEFTASHNEPYAHNVLRTGTPFSYLPGETQKELETIDKFMDMELTNKHMVKNVSSYDQAFNQLLMELSLRDAPLGEQIHQLAGYAANMLKLDGLEDIQKELRHKLKSLRTKKDMDNLVLKRIGKLII